MPEDYPPLRNANDVKELGIKHVRPHVIWKYNDHGKVRNVTFEVNNEDYVENCLEAGAQYEYLTRPPFVPNGPSRSETLYYQHLYYYSRVEKSNPDIVVVGVLPGVLEYKIKIHSDYL